MWLLSQNARPGTSDLNSQIPSELRTRVPITLASAGFVFIVVGELIVWRIHRKKRQHANKPKGSDSSPDDVEKLLNELLTQAEAKKARENETGNRSQEPGICRSPEAGTVGQNAGDHIGEKLNAPSV
jgi:hypothetical protein